MSLQVLRVGRMVDMCPLRHFELRTNREEDNSVIPFINLVKFREMEEHQNSICVIGGLGVTCSPRDPRFAGSNPTEVDGVFSGRKNPEFKSSGRDFKLDVLSPRFQAR